MNPFKLTVTLKQHTPLLHFQHEQAGATLRASEVKPKLDRFLIETIGEANMAEEWFLETPPDRPKALTLKLKINAIGKPGIDVVKTLFSKEDQQKGISGIIGSYFGKDKGLTWRWPNKLTITISSFYPDLIQVIKQQIVAFFVLHNFGQRQTKGFGSFTVSQIDQESVGENGQEDFSSIQFERILQKFYDTVYYFRGYTNEPLKYIHREYQLLKSGRNNPKIPDFYRKSGIFEYFINSPSPIRWEKRKIKQQINALIRQGNESFTVALEQTHLPPIDLSYINNQYYNSYKDQENNEYRYVRALLGLAENNEYLTKAKTLKYVVKIGHDAIERSASPILFKVFNNRIYLLPQPIPDILGEWFTFTLYAKKQVNGEWQEVKNGLEVVKEQLETIKTPDYFDLPDFLKKHLGENWKPLTPNS